MAHMNTYNLFCKKHGFIPGQSMVLQLMKVLNRWTEILDEGHAVDVIYCDFMKASDRAPHTRLLSKINS